MKDNNKIEPSWCPHGKHYVLCQNCEEYYYQGLGYCEKSHPREELKDGKKK